MKQTETSTSRRNFLGRLATGATALGLASVAVPFSLEAASYTEDAALLADEADDWFKKNLTGKHKMVFDAPQPHGIFPFAWPLVFQLTNQATGTPIKDTSVLVVLRHNAIPYAMQNDLWTKYKFGEMFKVEDPVLKAPVASRNPFWKPKDGDFKVPGVGNVNIGINQLQENGVKFCVCDMALTVYSAVSAGMQGDPVAIKKEWMAGILPGIQVVPSGVWAIGRAQEHGCAYCFAG